MHHDGKEFYKAVFDTIIPGSYQHYFSLFSYHAGEGNSVKVILKGKPMWLLPDKTLKPEQIEKTEKEVAFIENNKETAVEVDNFLPEKTNTIPEKKPVIIKSYKQSNLNARIEKFRDSFFLYINDKLIPEFTSKYMNDIYSHKDSTAYLLLINWNDKMGIVNLTQRKLSVPIEYDQLIANNTDYIYATKNGLNGIINAENRPLIPIKYKKLDFIIRMKQKNSFYLASDSRGYFFLEQQNTLVKESGKIYDYLSILRGKQLLFLAIKNKASGIINTQDSVIVPLKYKSIKSSQDISRFAILQSQKDLYGFVDMENNFFKVEPAYNELSRPQEMMFQPGKKSCFIFLATKKGKSFYVDNLGKEFVSR